MQYMTKCYSLQGRHFRRENDGLNKEMFRFGAEECDSAYCLHLCISREEEYELVKV